jgi:ABC-type phosphate/phosphonate transport system permease subunit
MTDARYVGHELPLAPNRGRAAIHPSLAPYDLSASRDGVDVGHEGRAVSGLVGSGGLSQRVGGREGGDVSARTARLERSVNALCWAGIVAFGLSIGQFVGYLLWYWARL